METTQTSDFAKAHPHEALDDAVVAARRAARAVLEGESAKDHYVQDNTRRPHICAGTMCQYGYRLCQSA